tara:strand:+ start:1870 stop:3765 length:1896 start_codon:yes stop_codon:yes gene_type:complete
LIIFIFFIKFILKYFIHYKMSSYWRNDEKIPMKQTQTAIPSTNGLSYSGTAGQGGKRVDFEVPQNIKFMDGKNSYLNFDVKLSPDVAVGVTRLSLDPFIGGQSLIKNIRIYSGNRGVLLESIEDYDAKVSLEYSYDQDESIRKMRALKEGSLVETPLSRGTAGTSVSNNIDISTNPYFVQELQPAGRDYDATDFTTAKVSLPLHTGIFADSEKIFPCMLTGGLYVEIDLQDCARCVVQLDSVNRHRRMKQNPLIRGSDVDGGAFAIGATDFTEIYLALDNNMTAADVCPFVKGEKIGICSATDPTAQPSLTINGGTADQGFPTVVSVTTENNAADVAFVKITTTAFRNSAVGTGVAITTDAFILYSAALDRERVQYADRTVNLIPAITAYSASYTVSNLELVVQQVELDPRYEAGMVSKMKEGGVIEMDILSATNYKHSVLSSNRNATLNLPLSNTRAKSIFAIPTDATSYNVPQRIAGLSATYDEERLAMDGRLNSIRSGKVGCIDKLTSYQWLIDDKLTPQRPIDVSKINGAKSISAQPLIELEKSLNQAKIVARSFCDFNRNFVVSRAYALNDGVMDLNNKSNQLQLVYNERTVAGVDEPPTKDKLFLCFVYHLRRISIKGDSVSVTL